MSIVKEVKSYVKQKELEEVKLNRVLRGNNNSHKWNIIMDSYKLTR